MIHYIFWLVVGHCVADYPLQSDFMAKGKNYQTPIPGMSWRIILLSHALIHGGAVVFATNNLGLGFFEVLIHYLIDYLKCRGLFGFKFDQFLHVLCKIIYVALLCLFPETLKMIA